MNPPDQQANPRVEADVTRLILAVDERDTRTELALIASLSAEMTPVWLIDRIARLVNVMGHGTHGDQWPHILTDTINVIDIDTITDDEG